MKFSRALAACGAALLLLCAAPLASAQSVLLVRPHADDDVLSEAFNRLRAELVLQGFEISVVEPDAGASSPEALAALAQKEGAFAGISLTRGAEAAAEVCIADRVTGKISLRSVALDKGRDAPSVLAVRTTDLLRASLREFASDQKPPPEVVGVDRRPVPREVQRFAGVAPPRFQLDVQAALVGLGQKFGPGYAPSLGLSYRAFDRAGLALRLTGPALGASYQNSTGSAVVRQELGLLEVWFVALQRGPFELCPALVAGVYHLDAIGEVQAPLTARSGQVTSFAAGLNLGVNWRLSQRLALGAAVSGLAFTPRPEVGLLAESARVSWPFLTASAGLGVAF
jgi:hypothetical protein